MKYDKLIIDSSYTKTELCELGIKYPTDKSPYVKNLHRHPYTAVYDFLFFPFKNKNISFAEFGVYENQSMKCWREYFPNAFLYAFDNDQKHLTSAINDNLKDTHYSFVDVASSHSIQETLTSTNTQFDIILDDASHKLDHQINIIKNSYSFIKPGGILIIEDIFRKTPEKKYIDAIGDYEKYFDRIIFILCEHLNRDSSGWDNDKILVMIRNDII